jgi:hypothetical protein
MAGLVLSISWEAVRVQNAADLGEMIDKCPIVLWPSQVEKTHATPHDLNPGEKLRKEKENVALCVRLLLWGATVPVDGQEMAHDDVVYPALQIKRSPK